MAIFGKERLGIDLGTANTVISVANKGIALREPSLLAVEKQTQKVVAFGREASRMEGRTSDNYELIHPLQHGAIAHFSYTKQMLAHFMSASLKYSFSKPEVVLTAPCDLSKVERKAIIDSIRDLGINRAMIVEAPYAVALAAGLEVEQARGKMVVDIGEGTTDIAVISYGETVKSLTLKQASGSMNDKIAQAVRNEHQLLIGDYTAETLKIVLGNALYESDDQDHLLVRGRSVAQGVPSQAKVSAALVAEAINEVIGQILLGIRQVLEQTPVELSADLLETGILLSGGGCLLKRLATRIEREIGIPVRSYDYPFDAAAIGAGKLFDQLNYQSKQIERQARL